MVGQLSFDFDIVGTCVGLPWEPSPYLVVYPLCGPKFIYFTQVCNWGHRVILEQSIAHHPIELVMILCLTPFKK